MAFVEGVVARTRWRLTSSESVVNGDGLHVPTLDLQVRDELCAESGSYAQPALPVGNWLSRCKTNSSLVACVDSGSAPQRSLALQGSTPPTSGLLVPTVDLRALSRNGWKLVVGEDWTALPKSGLQPPVEAEELQRRSRTDSQPVADEDFEGSKVQQLVAVVTEALLAGAGGLLAQSTRSLTVVARAATPALAPSPAIARSRSVQCNW